jgi:hypothetical protein
VQKVALERVLPWPVTIPVTLHTCASPAGSYEVIVHTDFSNSLLLPAKNIYIIIIIIIIKVKCTLVQALRLCTGRTAHKGSRDIVLLFHDHGTRRG